MFFSECSDNAFEKVHFTFTKEGRPTGEGYIEFTNEDDFKAALKRNNEYMGNRYIEGWRFLMIKSGCKNFLNIF